MTAAIALDPGFSEVRVWVAESGKSEVGLRILSPRSDPFEWFQACYGTHPTAVIVAGGSYAECAPGVYALDADLAGDAAKIDEWHPRNRMTVRAFTYCQSTGIPGVVVDPMSSVSLPEMSRFSGVPGLSRRGILYAYPQRQAASIAAGHVGQDPAGARVITVYLGDEVAVAAHIGGEVIETSDPVRCEGPFGFTSAGTVPGASFVSWLAKGSMSRAGLIESLKFHSGAFAGTGVSDLSSFEAWLEEGDSGALLAARAMAYQVSKEIGRALAALRGDAHAIAVTGPGIGIGAVVSGIEERVAKWCPVIRVNEAEAALRLCSEGLAALAANTLLRYPQEKRS